MRMMRCWGSSAGKTPKVPEGVRGARAEIRTGTAPGENAPDRFGRYATERRAKRGEGKPETFNFLGFTHIGGTSHKTGYFTVQRRTMGKRMAAKLQDVGAKLRERLHASPAGTGKWLAQVVRGYFQYHAIPGNWARLEAFRNGVQRIWFRTLRRRSQRCRLTWERFRESLGSLLPPIQILPPYPSVRFDAKHPNIRGRTRVR